MRIRKWLMKQQWRIVQIRSIWSLFYGILLLAYAYYSYIAFFVNMGVLGPIVFAVVILGTFLILGYIYDRVFVMWAPAMEVAAERNPYQYVPGPMEHVFWFPAYSSMLDALECVAKDNGVDTSCIDDARAYFAQLQKLRPERREDIARAIELNREFLATHSFADLVSNESADDKSHEDMNSS